MSTKEQSLGTPTREYAVYGRSNLAAHARVNASSNFNRLPWPTAKVPSVKLESGKKDDFGGASVLDMVEKIMRVVEVQSREQEPTCDEPTSLQLVSACAPLEEPAAALPLPIAPELELDAERACDAPVVGEASVDIPSESELADEAKLIELVNESDLIGESEPRMERPEMQPAEIQPAGMIEPQPEELPQASQPQSENLVSQLTAWLRNQFVTRQSRKRLRVCETVSLGEKRFVAVIQVDGEQFLVGGAANSVATLARLEPQQDFSDVLKRRWTGAIQV